MATRPGPTLLIVALCAAVFAYLPGLSGPFLFDDRPNLLLNSFVHLNELEWGALRDAALSNESGLFTRAIPSLSFALNYYFAGGFTSFPFKLTNLAIHLFNGILLYLLAQRLAQRFIGGRQKDSRRPELLAAAIAGIWLLHPLQLTSVLYVVQRMNSLSALFVLAGLLIFTIGRARLERGGSGSFVLMTVGVAGGGALGVLCKENAALIPLYAVVIEVCCFSSVELEPRNRHRLRIYYWAVLGLPLLIALTYAATHPGFILDGYRWRTFSLGERVLTQPRVLLYYLWLVFFPSREMLGLFHDDFPLSVGFFTPLTTIFAILAWVALVALAVFLRRRTPVLLFAVSWFLAGHLMESTVLSLEMVFEHRNYLPSIGPIAALVFAVSIGFERFLGRARLAHLTLALFALTVGFVTHSRAYSWSESGILLESLIKHHSEAPRTHGYYAEVLMTTRSDPEKAFHHLQQYSRLTPESINGLAEMLRMVKAVRASTSSGGVVGEPAEFSLFETPLPSDSAVLHRFESELVEEIERRIQSYPVSGSTVKTVVDLQGCLYQGSSVCVELAPALSRWSELALSNPRIGPRRRAILLLSAAKIQTWLGNVHRGIAYAELAAASDPGSVHFQIELAKLHLQLGNRDAGLSIIESIRRRGTLLGFRMREVVELESRLRSIPMDPDRILAVPEQTDG
jgi:hypothetical protein